MSSATLETSSSAMALGEPRLLAGTADGALLDLDRHRAVHGRLRATDLPTLAVAVERLGMLGRGGAAFPVAVKLRGTAPGPETRVVVNVSEGEPASRKDRTIARLAPHLLVDGALLVGAALQTQRVHIVVGDRAARGALQAACEQRSDARGVQVVAAAGGFVGGEVRAVARHLSGGPARPPGTRTPPSIAGVRGRPTFASNAETFAQLELLGTHGPDWYGEVGAGGERGTTLLTILGETPLAGVVEAPFGTGLAELVGPEPGPVLVGGYHGTWADVHGRTLDRAELRAHGIHLGAGVLARLPETTCALAELAAVTRWLAAQSAGQCGPCVFGLPALADAVDGIRSGQLPAGGWPALDKTLGLLPRRGACAHPDGAVRFVASALAIFQVEVAQHLAGSWCGHAYQGVLPLDDAKEW